MALNQIRTTVYLDEGLYIAAKKKALEERRTLTSLIQEGLKEQVAKKKKTSDYKKESWEKIVKRLGGGIKLKKYPTPEELNKILDDRYVEMLPRGEELLRELASFRKKYGKQLSGKKGTTRLIRQMRSDRTQHLTSLLK